MHSRVFLTLVSFMIHDNPRPRNKSQKSKVDWCLETDHNSISIRDKPDALFRAAKMHLPVAFYRRLSWTLSVSRNLGLYAIFTKESHRNTSVCRKSNEHCTFRADLVQYRSKRRGYEAPKAHPNAFTELLKCI